MGHVITKLSKVKDKGRISKATREKQLVMILMRLSADTLQARGERDDKFKVLKEPANQECHAMQNRPDMKEKLRFPQVNKG